MEFRRGCRAALFLAALAAAACRAPAAGEVVLAADGVARLPVVVSEQASPRVRAAAQTLAAYLGRMSGAAFAVVTNAPPDGQPHAVTLPTPYARKERF